MNSEENSRRIRIAAIPLISSVIEASHKNLRSNWTLLSTGKFLYASCRKMFLRMFKYIIFAARV